MKTMMILGLMAISPLAQAGAGEGCVILDSATSPPVRVEAEGAAGRAFLTLSLLRCEADQGLLRREERVSFLFDRRIDETVVTEDGSRTTPRDDIFVRKVLGSEASVCGLRQHFDTKTMRQVDQSVAHCLVQQNKESAQGEPLLRREIGRRKAGIGSFLTEIDVLGAKVPLQRIRF